MKNIALLILIILIFSCCTDKMRDVKYSFSLSEMSLDEKASLRGLNVYDEDRIAVSGNGCVFSLTEDEGNNWETRKLFHEVMDFRDVELQSSESILLLTAGQPARIYRSNDEGKNWRITYEDLRNGIFFDSFAFWNEEVGMVFSDPIEGEFVILETIDGGEHWSQISPERIPEAKEGEAGFAASGTMLTTFGNGHVWFGTGGATARVFHSRDYGKNWEVNNTPILQGENSQGIFSIVFKDSLNGVIVGGDYTKENKRDSTAAWTNDGGKTWNLSTTMPFGFRSCIDYTTTDDRTIYVATGPGGTDYSIDDGVNWIHIKEPGYHTIQFVKNDNVAWLSGYEGRIAKLEISVTKE